MKTWLVWIGLYLTLAIADDPPADPPADDPAADDPPADDAPADDPPADDAPGDDPPADDPAARQARRRDVAAEERQRREAADAENVRLRAENQSLRPKPVDAEFEREEAILRDPKTTETQKWQIGANRTLRESKRSADSALAQARDISDRTSFDIACSKNKRLASVKNDVEEHLKKLAAQGQSAPREAVATFLLGQRVLNAPERKPAPAVDRGKTPGARSDVRAKGATTEQQKRTERLRGVQI